MEWGREQPPDIWACPVPRPSRRVAHAPVPLTQTAMETACDLRVVCGALFVACSSPIADGMHCTFDADPVPVLVCVGHHMISVELCSTSSRLSLRSTLRASALTTSARSSEVAAMRWPAKLGLIFCVDRMRRQSYGEDLVDAVGHPSAASPDAER